MHPLQCILICVDTPVDHGFPIVRFYMQKLNSPSSTESDIVGADDFMPPVCWTHYFMQAQGYKIEDNIMYQDSKSSILRSTRELRTSQGSN